MRQKHFEAVIAAYERHIDRLERELEGVMQTVLDLKVNHPVELKLRNDLVVADEQISEPEPGTIFTQRP